MTEREYEPIRKVIDVSLSQEEAFTLFTDRMKEWWPLESHSVFNDRSREIIFQAWEGGKLIESGPNDETSVWGTVSVADRPNRLVFSWHPGRDPETAQEVEVRFTKAETGCQVELEHRGWERYGEAAAKSYEGYVSGWDYVFVQRFGGKNVSVGA